MANITADLNITGEINVTGDLKGTINIGGGKPKLQEKTVTPTTTAQTVVADAGYDGLSQVEVRPVALQYKTVTPGSEAQVVSPDTGFIGLSGVTVEAASGGGGQKIVCNTTGAFSASMKAAFETLENIEEIEFTSVESFASADLSTIGKNNAVDVYLTRAEGTECLEWPFNANAAQDAEHEITLHVPANLSSAYHSSQMGNWYEFPYSNHEYFSIVGDL